MVKNKENVARAIFSPRMIVDGEIQPETFCLRAAISEEYLSVMRMSVASWQDDIRNIPQRKNRRLFGFAEMNVREIRNIQLKRVKYDVKECDNEKLLSHAGIFITVDGERLIGGQLLKTISSGIEQDFLLLAIQRELMDIAQKGLREL